MIKMRLPLLPKTTELLTESDVEQKLIWPLLTMPYPEGLGYSSADIFTKTSTRRLKIGKGGSAKLYFPDYLVILGGLPTLVVEAKTVGEPLDEALAEARLYGVEVNALFAHGVNPCMRVVACNGEALWTAPIDSAEPDLKLTVSVYRMRGWARGWGARSKSVSTLIAEMERSLAVRRMLMMTAWA